VRNLIFAKSKLGLASCVPIFWLITSVCADTAILYALPSELAALKQELRMLQQPATAGKPIKIADRQAYVGYKKGEKVILVQSGSGQIPAAICAQLIKSTVDTVNMHLFLAESQAKQGKDYSATLQELQTKATEFRTQEQKDYARYRIAKFYESQGQPDQAAARYQQLVTYSASMWSAAALTMLGKLAEKQGNLQRALQLYLEYPQRFPEKPRLVLQSYASALNAAEKLGDTEATDQILAAIAERSAAVQDYNVHLNLAFNYRKKGQHDLAKRFLESGVALAAQELARTSAPEKRYKIHFHVLRRLSDVGAPQQVLDYFAAHSDDFGAPEAKESEAVYSCMYFKAVALHGSGRKKEGMQEFELLLRRIEGQPKLEAIIGSVYGLFLLGAKEQEADALLAEIAERFPTHPWANIGRLELAIRNFQRGDISNALSLVEAIIATSSGSAKMQWEQTLYWSAVYGRGLCLKAQGKYLDGEKLMQEASQQIPTVRKRWETR
jgi:tetratricopeptide (TPR) repeat protein